MTTRRSGTAARRPRAGGPGLFKRHLWGDYPLGRSFWVHTLLVGWGLGLLAAWAASRVGQHHLARHVSMAILVFQPLAFMVWVWSIVGTWMSAMKHIFDGRGKRWALIAMFLIASSAFAAISESPALMPFLREHWEVAHGKQPTPSFSVALADNGRVIDYHGGVNEGAAAALEKLVNASPKATTVRLQSPGGWVGEGRRLADVVKRYGLKTHVDEGCFSACTLVFLAGRERTAGAAAQVGFHHSRAIGSRVGSAGADGDDDEAKLYLAAGLSPAFVQQVLNTPSRQMWVPTRRQLLEAGVLTR